MLTGYLDRVVSAAFYNHIDLDKGLGVATHYRTLEVEGHEIFYREVGPLEAPVLLLLHGFRPARTCSGT
jgi:hypothetical protein